MVSRDPLEAKPQRTITPTCWLNRQRAKPLAEKIAGVLNNEDVSGVSFAVCALTSGVVHQYATYAAGLSWSTATPQDPLPEKYFFVSQSCPTAL
jgi:hypothetical protein